LTLSFYNIEERNLRARQFAKYNSDAKSQNKRANWRIIETYGQNFGLSKVAANRATLSRG